MILNGAQSILHDHMRNGTPMAHGMSLATAFSNLFRSRKEREACHLTGLPGQGRKEGSVPCPGQPELAYKGDKECVQRSAFQMEKFQMLYIV